MTDKITATVDHFTNLSMEINNISLETNTLQPNAGLVLVLCLISVTALVGNLFTIVCFFVYRKLRLRPSNFYILGLAITDVFVALISVPGYIVITATGKWPFSRQTCQVFNYFRLVVELASPLMTILISYDRYFLLSCTYDTYVRSRRRNRITIELCSAWILPMVGHFISFLFWHITVSRADKIEEYSTDCLDIPSDADIPFAVLYSVITIFVPAALLIFFNAQIGRKCFLRYFNANVHVGPVISSQSDPGPGSSTNKTKSNVLQIPEAYSVALKLPDCSPTKDYVINVVATATCSSNRTTPCVKTKQSESKEITRYIRPLCLLCLLVIVFCISWIPFSLYYLYVHLICPSCLDKTLYVWLVSLLYFNACINPMVYAVSNRSIRQCGRQALNSIKRRLWP